MELRPLRREKRQTKDHSSETDKDSAESKEYEDESTDDDLTWNEQRHEQERREAQIFKSWEEKRYLPEPGWRKERMPQRYDAREEVLDKDKGKRGHI